PDTPSRSERFPHDQEKAKIDSQWGWIMLSGAYIFTPNDGFKQFVSGEKDSGWVQSTWKLHPLGKAVAKDGKLILEGSTAKYTGIWFFSKNHKNPKIAVQPGMKLKFTVKTFGKGELMLGYSAYSDKGYQGTPLKKFKLSEKLQEFSAVFVNRRPRFVCPSIRVMGQGRAVIEDYRMEILPKN
ncbi:MAG: hypothetical protein PHV59_09280, partial [Victivallales bacterium]|nr:hypothetical protein [Victivallales bacterium]